MPVKGISVGHMQSGEVDQNYYTSSAPATLYEPHHLWSPVMQQASVFLTQVTALSKPSSDLLSHQNKNPKSLTGATRFSLAGTPLSPPPLASWTSSPILSALLSLLQPRYPSPPSCSHTCPVPQISEPWYFIFSLHRVLIAPGICVLCSHFLKSTLKNVFIREDILSSLYKDTPSIILYTCILLCFSSSTYHSRHYIFMLFIAVSALCPVIICLAHNRCSINNGK